MHTLWLYNNDSHMIMFAIKLMKRSPPGNSNRKYCRTSRKRAPLSNFEYMDLPVTEKF